MPEFDFKAMMQLEPHGADTFVATGPSYPWGGLYGGQIIAQALRAASLSVEPEFAIHSLHAYFIRGGDAKEPIRLEVDRIRNGRTFTTRRVVARQSIGAILNMAVSFHADEEGEHVQTEEMPDVAAAETLQTRSWTPLIDRRFLPKDIELGRVGAWLRLTQDLGDDPVINACALAYLSDDMPTDAVVSRHSGRPPRDAEEWPFWNASLDHAIWFHRPLRAREWHLHDFHCRGLTHARGLASGSIFDQSGHHVATVAQEVLIRQSR